MSEQLRIQFDAGTLTFSGGAEEVLQALPFVQLDARTSAYRAEARHYRAIVEKLRAEKIEFLDEARAYQPLECKLTSTREPFPHQREALHVWWNQGGRGVVVLPTGTGKTLVALLAIAHVRRPTLVITPTIPLMNQWYGELLHAFPKPADERSDTAGHGPLTPDPSPPEGRGEKNGPLTPDPSPPEGRGEKNGPLTPDPSPPEGRGEKNGPLTPDPSPPEGRGEKNGPLTPDPSPPEGRGEKSGPIGLLGGGYYDLQPLTVTTYDSAYIHLERWGNRYGLVVFDECHHLPSGSYQFAAIGAIAPYRLGLTATPERADGREALLPELIGPIVYRREIKELAGDFLAEYRVVHVEVDLSPEETERYNQARATYRQFVQDNRISMGSPAGWRRFLQLTFQQPDGRAAFQAYREQRRLALAAPAKIELLDELLHRHAADRAIIFTYDNASVYQIARRFLVPAITHQTKTKERQQILARFQTGEYNVVVTSQVLNEGVDVPAANVGIILSGTGSVREHVQRLGRLLRKHGDKQALLYEVVTRATAEEYTSERRRQHGAYQ